MIFSKPNKILAVMAHPDDEILTCYGTLARFSAEGTQIVICFFTDGHEGRLAASVKAGTLINARVNVVDEMVSDNEIHETRRIVRLVDELLVREKPSIVITHTPAERDHHEHRILGRIVSNSVMRCGESGGLWFAEPLCRNAGFQPNLFVDVSDSMTMKLQALAIHRTQRYKWNLEDAIVEQRGRWWARQSPKNGASFCEAFSIQYSFLQ